MLIRNLNFRFLYIIVPMLFLFSCQQNKTENSTITVESKPETFVLTYDSLQTTINLPAELYGFREVELYAKVNSYVKNLWTDIGSDVKQGQLLIDLEAPEMQSQLIAAKSKLATQEAVAEASNSFYKRLLETNKIEGTISANDIEQALAKRNADRAQLETTKAVVKEILNNLDYLKIRAPFSGKINMRNVNIGAYVGSNSTTPLLQIVDDRKLRLVTYLPESYTGLLKIGQKLQFKIASLRGEVFYAKINRMSGALDKTLRTEQIELDIDNTNGKLLPGMVAEISIDLKAQKRVFFVNKLAVSNTAEGSFVYRINNNIIERISIENGIETTDRIEIYAADLSENDILLTKANPELRSGDKI